MPAGSGQVVSLLSSVSGGRVPRSAELRLAAPKRKPLIRRMTPELVEMIELMYPDTTARAIAEALGTTEVSVHHVAWRRKFQKAKPTLKLAPLGHERDSWSGYLMRKCNDGPDRSKRFLFAHVLAWEEHHGRKKPADHVVVFIDGDKRNFEKDNLYCLPECELLAWMRFISAPLEVHVDRLIRRVMALDTSEAVQKKLLEQLEKLVDPEQKVDLHRQRVVCETVQTLVNLLKVEIDYLRAIEGDGSIPFLETKHTAKARLKKLPKDPLLRGPAEDHVWRGLGNRKAN
jgi:hypothetical protein